MNQQQEPAYVRKPIAPPSHIRYAHTLGRGMLTMEQIDELVKPINSAYVERKQGMTYLAQHQARAEMNRIFGYGNWSSTVSDMELMYETQQPGSKDKNKLYWVVAYRCRVTVEIRDLWGMPVASFSEFHAEENAPQPQRGEAHALALTSVESYALRRALIGLGDRFGLGLYNGGSPAPHGQYTIQQFSGQLFQWEAVGAVPANTAPAPTVTHETIAAEPAVPEYAGEREQHEPPVHQQPGTLQDFNQVQQQLQDNRANMRDRVQAGMKVDQPGGRQ